MKKKKILIIIMTLLVIAILSIGVTYIPRHIVKINPNNVSKIHIFNGNTGEEIDIIEHVHITKIIENLNEVKFKKDKCSFGYMGYSFRVSIYNKDNKRIKELIINSENTVRYKYFFRRAIENTIDYDYIEKLFENTIKNKGDKI